MLGTLLVEDNESLRRALRIGLEATGAVQVVGEVASGEEALRLCQAAPPQVVLMDVALAGAEHARPHMPQALAVVARSVSRLARSAGS